jgi:nucleotidyltransferase/DNA polymerase involved in DNA repair
VQAPRISCLDLDTFFVSVERLLDPTLRGKPVVVGGRRGGRGVVTSASYEVRAFGVRSGMSIREASERAPANTVFVPGNHEAHSEYSARARQIVDRFSPIVIAASIDEHYLDFSGCERLYRRRDDADDDATILRAVREMTAAIERELALPASAGIATNKSMAKVASGLAKPQGVLLVRAGTEADTLAPLGVRKLPGIGPVAEAKLHALGIDTLGQLVTAPAALVRPIFGAYTLGILCSARGDGNDKLGRERPAFREYDAPRRRRDDVERVHVHRDRRRPRARGVIGTERARRVARAPSWRARGSDHAQAALHRLRNAQAWAYDRTDERRLRDPSRRARAVSRGADAQAPDPTPRRPTREATVRRRAAAAVRRW